MSEIVDYKTQRKRDYHRKWRAEHQESVRAAQVRYWTKKAAEMAAQDKQIEVREEAAR